MRVLRVSFFLLFVSFFSNSSIAQSLKPGFDKYEFEEMIRINATFSESEKNKALIPKPVHAKLIYKSPELGLDNKWELWVKDNKVAVIGIRASTADAESWLANLFAVQIPAQGILQITEDYNFSYKLAENPKAAIHAGYVFSSAFLVRDILPKIDSLYTAGIRDIIITGHSQGGGIAYLLGANLLWRQKDGLLPADIQFKIYTSASPKPGNLYFAYDYERITQEGWSYHVVNTEDWVPQTPFTVQTISDLPTVSPIPFIQQNIAKQSFFKRLFFKSLYRKLTKPSDKAVATYQKYLGEYIGKRIEKKYVDFKIPKFSLSNDYVRVGRQIILYPDSLYFKQYDAAQNPKNFMLHHSSNAYYFLILQKNTN